VRHWHRCQRWWRRNEECPFGLMEEHEQDEDDLDKPEFLRLAIPEERKGVDEGDVRDAVAAEARQVPLPFPFPIPEPERAPQLPGMPPFRAPLPFPSDPARPLPGQPPLPDPDQLPLIPAAIQHVGEGAQNLVGGALGMVPNRFRATEAQMMELFGAFQVRRGDPPLRGRFARVAVAEEGAARVVQSARQERERISKKRLAMAAAATVAGAGVAFGVHKASTGGFGFLQVNMAAEMERLTSAIGSRRERDEEHQVGQFAAGKGGSEGGV